MGAGPWERLQDRVTFELGLEGGAGLSLGEKEEEHEAEGGMQNRRGSAMENNEYLRVSRAEKEKNKHNCTHTCAHTHLKSSKVSFQYRVNIHSS